MEHFSDVEVACTEEWTRERLEEDDRRSEQAQRSGNMLCCPGKFVIIVFIVYCAGYVYWQYIK